jgi:hypothetical protein
MIRQYTQTKATTQQATITTTTMATRQAAPLGLRQQCEHKNYVKPTFGDLWNGSRHVGKAILFYFCVANLPSRFFTVHMSKK